MAKSKTKFKIEIIVLELIIIACLLGVLFVDKVESYKFESDATYFDSGMDYKVKAGSIAKVDSKTKLITIDRDDDYDLEANGIPVIYDGRKKIVILKDMVYLKPGNGVVYSYKLSYFTEIAMTDNNVITISRDTNEAKETSGILFDGTDVYFFLQDMYLEIGEERIAIPAYSYVKAIRDNYLEIYNSSLNTIEQRNLKEELVYARDINDTYRINLETDVIKFNNGEVMLNTFINSYPAYFEASEE